MEPSGKLGLLGSLVVAGKKYSRRIMEAQPQRPKYIRKLQTTLGNYNGRPRLDYSGLGCVHTVALQCFDCIVVLLILSNQP